MRGPEAPPSLPSLLASVPHDELLAVTAPGLVARLGGVSRYGGSEG
jgi:hypothetical protein